MVERVSDWMVNGMPLAIKRLSRWRSHAWIRAAARLALAAFLAHSAAGMADTADRKGTCDAECVAVGQWQFTLGVGAGIRLNPLTDADDTPLFILPEVSYYGRRFFMRNLDVGFTLLETDRHQLNLLATPSYDQMYFNRWDPLNFTFAGGAGSASGTSAAARPGSSAYTSINISSTRSGGGLGASPADPSDSGAPGESTDGGGMLSVTGSVSADVQVEINGTLISMSSQVIGNEGNIINVSISDDLLSVDGISASDQLALLSDGTLELKDISGDLKAATMDVTGAERITVMAGPEAFVVNAQTRVESAPPQISYDAVKKRRLSGLAGVEYSYSLPWASVHLQALQDFTNIHHGQEVRVAAVIPLDFSSHKFALTLGANHKSREILDYYYGIDATEVASINGQYSIREGGTETLVRIDWQKPVNDKWTLRAKVQYLGLPSQITRSPLVAKDYVVSAFIGGVYHF